MRKLDDHEKLILWLAERREWTQGYLLNRERLPDGTTMAEANRRLYELFGSNVKDVPCQDVKRIINGFEYIIETDLIRGERSYRVSRSDQPIPKIADTLFVVLPDGRKVHPSEL